MNILEINKAENNKEDSIIATFNGIQLEIIEDSTIRSLWFQYLYLREKGLKTNIKKRGV
jgi:hypothetical protein